MHGLIGELLAAADAWLECPRCTGEGEVGYNPSRIGDPQEERSAKCPRCHGAGHLGTMPDWAREPISETDLRWRAVPFVEAWKEALTTAFSLSKADRARELRGDRSVARFNEQGLHPFSTEWGRLMALEALLPGLSDVREKLKVDDNGEVTELFVSTRVLRLEAREAAEEEYRAEIIAQHEGRPTDG